MKIILSHDVDHLSGLEHWREHYWPGLWYRGAKSLIKGSIGLKTYCGRAWPFQRLERIREVLEADRAVGATPTFFFGMERGLRLSYSYKQAKPYMDFLRERGCKVGVHGMAYRAKESMKLEYDRFRELIGESPSGVRNHYLRKSDSTLKSMADIGYLFDSTGYELRAPYRIGELWEFPISLMDVSLGLDTSISHKKEKSLALYNEALVANQPFFVLNFHDLYFANSYPTMRDWYLWFLEFLKDEGHEFTDFGKGINYLEKGEKA